MTVFSTDKIFRDVFYAKSEVSFLIYPSKHLFSVTNNNKEFGFEECEVNARMAGERRSRYR